MEDNIALIGFMGVGKSAVGRAIAQLCDMRHVDLDNEVERRSGREVREIIATDGEAAFREREHEALEALRGASGLVISCGGGIVLRDDNVRTLRELATVVFLTARIEDLLGRIEGDGGRPLLEGASDPHERAKEMLQERMPRYIGAAHYTVDTTGRDPDQVARLILNMMGVSP